MFAVTRSAQGVGEIQEIIFPNHDLLENHPIERITDLKNISSSNILFERPSLAFCSNLAMRSGSREIASYAVLFEMRVMELYRSGVATLSCWERASGRRLHVA